MKDYTWGVDVSTRKIAIAAVTAGEQPVVANEFAVEGKGAARLAGLFHNARVFARETADYYPPLSVWVERPTGSYPNPNLDHAVGVAVAGLYDGLRDLYLHPVPVELIAIGIWKRLAIGFGNASKMQVMEWAKGTGYLGGDQDCADALAIAVAGSEYATFENEVA